jgi:hypothetical protein
MCGSCATQCVIGLITDYIIPILSVGLPPDCNKQLTLYRKTANPDQLLWLSLILSGASFRLH